MMAKESVDVRDDHKGVGNRGVIRFARHDSSGVRPLESVSSLILTCDLPSRIHLQPQSGPAA